MELVNFLGIDYVKHGRTLKGCDCYGLVYLYYKEVLNIELPLYLDVYNNNKEINELITRETSLLPELIKVENPKQNDIVLMELMGLPIHLGIYMEKNNILHILHKTKSVIQTIASFSKRGKIYGYYRYDNK